MTNHDPRLIESPVRLCDSKLWDLQRNYFQTMGIGAWKEEVPFYISSNAFIATRYAKLVFNYIRDWQKLFPGQEQEPFTIVELGSGTGQFSFYFLKAFQQLLTQYQKNISFCYVITDVIAKNIEFCQDNPCFAPFVEQGVVDFALLNVQTDQDFHLIAKDKKYSTIKGKTPLIIVANYTFDCIKQDVFEWDKDKLNIVKLGLRSRYKNFDTAKSQFLSDLRLEYTLEQIQPEACYKNPVLNQILQEYIDYFKDKQAVLMMPLGALEFFDAMRSLTSGNFFAIVGDKGVSELGAFPQIDEFHATYDGCYTFPVNFHAIEKYIKHLGGDSLTTTHYNNFDVNIFSMGLSFNQLIETKACFKLDLEKTGPSEYCMIFDDYITSSYRFTLRSIIAFLRFSQWDPMAYWAIHDRLHELAPAIDGPLLADLIQDLDKVINNIYKLAHTNDVYNLIGMFYQSKNIDEKALDLYGRSLTVFGPSAAPLNNMAMIYEKQKNSVKALEHYQKSFALDKENRFAKRKIHALTGRPYLSAFFPVIKTIFIMSLIGFSLYLIS